MKHPILYAIKSHKSECELKMILIRFFHDQIMSFAVRISHFSQVSLLFLIGKFREIPQAVKEQLLTNHRSCV